MRVSTEKGFLEVIRFNDEVADFPDEVASLFRGAAGALAGKRLEGACYIQALSGFLDRAGSGAIPESLLVSQSGWLQLGIRAVNLDGALRTPKAGHSMSTRPALWMQFTNDYRDFPGALPQASSPHAELLLTDRGEVRFGGTINDGHNFDVGSTPVKEGLTVAGTLGDKYLARGVLG